MISGSRAVMAEVLGILTGLEHSVKGRGRATLENDSEKKKLIIFFHKIRLLSDSRKLLGKNVII